MRRIPELDALRGVAILMVLVYHTEYAVTSGPRPTRLLWLGVDLFFALSGFLITEILLRKPTARGSLLHFYARRALRIWPAYYLLVLFVWLFGTPLFGAPLRGTTLVHYLTFTQNVPFAPTDLAFHPALRSTWSLAVEEQFYLLWPPLTLWLGRKAMATLLASLTLLAVVARAQGGWFEQLVTRGDALALGSLLAVVLTGRATGATVRKGTIVTLAGTGILALAGSLGLHFVRRLASLRTLTAGVSAMVVFSLDVFCFNLASVCLIGLCYCRTGKGWLAPLRWRPLVFLGQISYGIFLYHRPIFRIVERAVGPMGYASLWVIPLLYVPSIVAAAVSWHVLEQPFLRLKCRFH
jgi:peptidoglycan/LPS O-acetylase OafA/YrhL